MDSGASVRPDAGANGDVTLSPCQLSQWAPMRFAGRAYACFQLAGVSTVRSSLVTPQSDGRRPKSIPFSGAGFEVALTGWFLVATDTLDCLLPITGSNWQGRRIKPLGR